MEHFETEWSITPKPDLATVCRIDRLACDRAGVSKEGFAVTYCKANGLETDWWQLGLII